MLTQLKCTEMKECVLRATSRKPLLCGLQVPEELMTKYFQMFQARWAETQGRHSSLECPRQAQQPLATAPRHTHIMQGAKDTSSTCPFCCCHNKSLRDFCLLREWVAPTRVQVLPYSFRVPHCV